MSHQRSLPSDARELPDELLSMIDARAAQEGVSRTEALARCLYEWRSERHGRAKSAPPPTTTDRELIQGSPAASDRTGEDARC